MGIKIATTVTVRRVDAPEQSYGTLIFVSDWAKRGLATTKGASDNIFLCTFD
jgi:hypothetical protein